MDNFRNKLGKIRQSYNEKLEIDDKERVAQEEARKTGKNKSTLERLRELFNFQAPPVSNRKEK